MPRESGINPFVEERPVCFYVCIYELTEQRPCKTIEEADELKRTLEQSWNDPAVIEVKEGTEEDYEAHFGKEKE